MSILTYANLTTAPLEYPASAAFSKSLAFIGDSRIFDSELAWKNVTWSDAKGLTLSVGFCTGQGITADSVGGGTLEYRAADAHMRWTAPGDTAGAWTPMAASWLELESATAGKGIRIGVRSMTGLPATDQTIAVTVSGTPQNAWQAKGFGTHVIHQTRWLNAAPRFLGLGGNTTGQVLEQMDWLEAQAGGIGYDVFQLATNDITSGTATATITANLQTIYDARRALGRRLVLVGEPARWGVNTSTAMTSAQQATHAAVNAFMANYAAADPENVIYVDAYTLTYDSGHSDRRPASGMLRDTVHYSDHGAQIVGGAVAAAIAAVTGYGNARAEGSAGNLMPSGYMTGTGGTIGTGASGTAPNGWTVSRSIGSDVTAAVSTEVRADGIAGNWMVLDITATTGAQLVQARGPSPTLGTLGLSVGDTVYVEIEMDIADVTGGFVEADAFCLFTGASPSTYIRPQLSSGTSQRQGESHGIRRSPDMVIPPGTTNMSFYVWVRTDGAAAATVKLASAAIVKAT